MTLITIKYNASTKAKTLATACRLYFSFCLLLVKACPPPVVLCNQRIHDPERNNENNGERGKDGLPDVDLIHTPCTSRTSTWHSSEPSLIAAKPAMAHTLALDGTVCSEAVVGVEMPAEMEMGVEMAQALALDCTLCFEVVVGAEMPAGREIEGEIEAFGVLS